MLLTNGKTHTPPHNLHFYMADKKNHCLCHIVLKLQNEKENPSLQAHKPMKITLYNLPMLIQIIKRVVLRGPTYFCEIQFVSRIVHYNFSFHLDDDGASAAGCWRAHTKKVYCQGRMTFLHLFFRGGWNTTYSSVESNTRSKAHTLLFWSLLAAESIVQNCDLCLLHWLCAAEWIVFKGYTFIYPWVQSIQFWALPPFLQSKSTFLDGTLMSDKRILDEVGQHSLLPALPLRTHKDSLSSFHSARDHREESILVL